ncbi:MAG TPA: nuclear transport factor 2 family protein [Nitrososphaerales archaeon]|nr:nuclear transport factor 2 family protein [Nitrososphaerales archaeon]
MIDPEHAVRKLFAAVNRRDLDVVAAAVAPNFRMYFTGQPDVVKTREEYRKHWEDFYKDNPDLKVRVLKVIVGDGKAAAELEMKYSVKDPRSLKRAKTERLRWAAFCSFDPEGLFTVASLENTRKVKG